MHPDGLIGAQRDGRGDQLGSEASPRSVAAWRRRCTGRRVDSAYGDAGSTTFSSLRGADQSQIELTWRLLVEHRTSLASPLETWRALQAR
jgi:hypothetical protein